MDFIFFNQADEILFTRNDAESATWQVDELLLNMTFPYDENKPITQGSRVAFEDDDGILQPFEIRKVRNYPIDNYQEVTAEHIVISELTDVHTGEQELTGVTASSALSGILSAQPSGLIGAKRWAVGNVTASGTSSGDIGMGSVWQNVRTIETNWNVYILPRVTWNASGITGRYLDIVPAAGVWHGLRLSVDKNADEVGVTVDDTEVKTALFGYGGNAFTYKTSNLDKDKEKITLVGYTWPGKPAGASINSTLGYIEDTAATAMYGRNGVPRFGFYQNGDIDDQATLAQKTWDALQTTNKPTVTVDCMVRDLYRMGYHDEKIRLHDTVMIDLLPMHDVLQLEVIQLLVDLLDPTATRPTIGAYIPNIIYIQRRTDEHASGGAGGGISGRRGGETETEAEWSEFQAEFVVNNAIMSYHAVQVDHDNKVLKAAGLDIDANGVIIYATNNANMIGSKFNVQSDQISLVVTTTQNPETGANSYKVNAASIVAGINNDTGTGESYVILNADRIYLDAAKTIKLGEAFFVSDGSNVWVKRIAQFGDGAGKIVTINGGTVNAPTLQVNAGGNLQFSPGSQTGTAIKINHATASAIVDSISKNTNLPSGQFGFHYTTIGNPNGTDINFNIADTQFFIDSVEAAKLEGWNLACDKITRVSNTIYGPQKNSYGNYAQKYTANYSASSYSASSHSHSSAWMKVDGHTYWSDKTVSLSNYTGNAQFNSGYDSYSPSSYSPSSFSWTTH